MMASLHAKILKSSIGEIIVKVFGSLHERWNGKLQKLQRLYAINTTVVVSLQQDSDRDRVIARYLRSRHYGFQVKSGAEVLALPVVAADYCKGRPRQALRTNRSRANSLGLKVRCVPAAEFEALAQEAARSRHALAYLGKLIQEPSQPYMETWIGTTAEDEIIAFARFAIGTSCAKMKYFAATQDREFSIIRWKMAADIFESFIARGIRHVVAGSVLEPSNGLAYYQDRLGFQSCRIALRHETAVRASDATGLGALGDVMPPGDRATSI